MRAFDHLAYLVRDSARSVQALMPFFPEVELLREGHERQGAYITYLTTSDGSTTIELVEPFEKNRLLSTRLEREKQQCLPYHVCFRVDDFGAECKRLGQEGWLTLTRPFAGFGAETQAAHFYKPAAGIVEIVGRRQRR